MPKFSIKHLLILIALVAVIYTVWSQRKLESENSFLSERLVYLDHEARVKRRLVDLYASLDTRDDEDMKILKLVQRLSPRSIGVAEEDLKISEMTVEQYERLRLEEQKVPFRLRSDVLLSDMDGTDGQLEVLSLCTCPPGLPHGMFSSVNVLFGGNEVIDVLIRSKSTRLETHTITLADTDKDNRLELVIDYTPGVGNNRSARPGRITYAVTLSGFKPMDSNQWIK